MSEQRCGALKYPTATWRQFNGPNPPCGAPIRLRSEDAYRLSNGSLLRAGSRVRVPSAVAHAIPEDMKVRLNLTLDDDYTSDSEVLIRPDEPLEHIRIVEGACPCIGRCHDEFSSGPCSAECAGTDHQAWEAYDAGHPAIPEEVTA